MSDERHRDVRPIADHCATTLIRFAAATLIVLASIDLGSGALTQEAPGPQVPPQVQTAPSSSTGSAMPGAADNKLASPATPAAQTVGSLPSDLSPWSMFLNADIVVKIVMVGLAFASVAT